MIRKWKNRVLPKGVVIDREYVYLRVRKGGKTVRKECFGKASSESIDKATRELYRLRERLRSDPTSINDDKAIRWPFPYACDEFVKHRPHWRYFKTALNSFFGGYFLDELTFVKVEKYRPFRAALGIADSSINKEIAMVSAMYNLFRRLRNVKEIPFISLPVENPTLGVAKIDESASRRRRIISPEEFQTIMAEATPRLQRAILAAFNTGLRRKDVFSLNASGNDRHADLLEGTMHKVGSIYRIDKNEMMSSLYDTAKDGVVIDRTNHKREFLELRDKCVKHHGIEDFVFKDFRRSAAWQVWLSEKNIFAVMAFLQHKKITTTQRYLGISSDDVKKAVAVLESKFSYQIQKAQKRPKTSETIGFRAHKTAVN